MSAPTVRGDFPFPIPETTDPTDVGIGTAYLIGHSYEKVVELFWRAKSFKISCTVSGKIPANSNQNFDAYPSSDIVGDMSDDLIIEPSRNDETEAVANLTLEGVTTLISIGGQKSAPGTTPPPAVNPDFPGKDFSQAYWGTYSSGMSLTVNLILFENDTPYPPPHYILIGKVQNPRCVKFGDLYYPAMSFLFEASMDDGFDHALAFGFDGTLSFDGTFYFNSNFIPVTPEPILGYSSSWGSADIIDSGDYPLRGSIFGVAIDDLGFTLSALPTTEGGFGSPNGQKVEWGDRGTTIDIDIKEWWPHDPGDGRGPYWDSTTGDPIARG